MSKKLKVFTGDREGVKLQIEYWLTDNAQVSSIVNVKSNLNKSGYVMCYIIYEN
jgi:hypothetical protein